MSIQAIRNIINELFAIFLESIHFPETEFYQGDHNIVVSDPA